MLNTKLRELYLNIQFHVYPVNSEEKIKPKTSVMVCYLTNRFYSKNCQLNSVFQKPQ